MSFFRQFWNMLWSSPASFSSANPLSHTTSTFTTNHKSEKLAAIGDRTQFGMVNSQSTLGMSAMSETTHDLSFSSTLESPLQPEILNQWIADVSRLSSVGKCDGDAVESIEMKHIASMSSTANANTVVHDFEVYESELTTFCDVCGDSIWGSMMSVRCRCCHVTCHNNCSSFNTVDCVQSNNVGSNATASFAVSFSSASNSPAHSAAPSLNSAIKSNTHTFINGGSNDDSGICSDLEAPLCLRHIEEVMRLRNEGFPGRKEKKQLRKHRRQLLDNVTAIRSSSADNSETRSKVITSMVYDVTTLDKEILTKYGIRLREISQCDSDDGPSFVAILSSTPFSKKGVHFAGTTAPWLWKDLHKRIKVFCSNDNGMMLEQNCMSISGSLPIYINFIRPVKVFKVAEYDTNAAYLDLRCHSNDGRDGLHGNVETHFIPRGAPKMIYVKLEMTVQEVINAVLKKFNIFDNPKKFALYEHTIQSDSSVTIRRMNLNECPLVLLLSFASTNSLDFRRTMLSKKLVLQENETGDIDWEAFSFYELRNFLIILQKEEDEYRHQIELIYEKRRKEALKLLQKLSNGGVEHGCSPQPSCPELA